MDAIKTDFYNLCRDPKTEPVKVVEFFASSGLFERWDRQLVSTQAKKKRKLESQIDPFEDQIEVPWLKKDPSEKAPEPAAPIGPAAPTKVEGPLAILCECEGDPEKTQWMVRKMRNFLNEKDKLERNVLHLAAFAGNTKLVKMFSPMWIDIHTPAQDNMQALHFAASAGHTETVKECVKRGARVNAATAKGGKTALYFARQKGHDETCAFLESKGVKDTCEMDKDEDFQEFLRSKENPTKDDQTRNQSPEDGPTKDDPPGDEDDPPGDDSDEPTAGDQDRPPTDQPSSVINNQSAESPLEDKV